MSVGGGSRIETATGLDDNLIFQDSSAEDVAATLRGNTLEGVKRRGKYLWFELHYGPLPLFHFGMTGRFATADEASFDLITQPFHGRETHWPPRFTKIHLLFENGRRLAYLNPRRFGRIRLLSDPPQQAPVKELGIDPLLEELNYPALEPKLRRRRTLKGILLDQRIIAGVGNWIADEALFQSGLDPRRKGDEVSSQEWERLLHLLVDIITIAVGLGAHKERFPKSWLFHSRWRRTTRPAQRRTDVEFLKVAGRTTAWVPQFQH